MPKLNDVILSGKSDKKYKFEVFAIDTDFNSVGGVYAITKRTVNPEGKGSHKVIYVGESEDISERFNAHHKAECFDRWGANCICVLTENDDDTRLSIEDDLITNYSAPCNG